MVLVLCSQDLWQLEQLAASAHDFGTPAPMPKVSGDAPLQCTRKLLGLVILGQ